MALTCCRGRVEANQTSLISVGLTRQLTVTHAEKHAQGSQG